ncbi:hypothetical protein [Streptomyces sp. NPDC056682]|uniref:hypothetical protein n=1 Tax=Streptomyces sp. NPDC056682 TaxID=3345909 RepID=UPI0036A0153F
MPIEPGQIYLSVNPSTSDPRNGHRRIKVVGRVITIPGVWGYGKVEVVTLTESGREVRRRSIEAAQLHATATTREGKPRRAGYVLERP